MATQPTITIAPRTPASYIPKLVGKVLWWLVFIAGMVTTGLLAYATLDTDAVWGHWLSKLLFINKAVLGLLLLGILHAIWRIYNTHLRLVRGLLYMLAAQFAIALLMAVLPLLLIYTATESYYGEQLDKALEASAGIRTGVMRQAHAQLDNIATELLEQLEPTLVNGEENAGFLLDELRAHSRLSLLALIDANGLVSQFSPLEAVPPTFDALDLQRMREGLHERSMHVDSDGLLRLGLLRPLTHAGGLAGGLSAIGLWLEQPLTPTLSDRVQAVEEGFLSYNNTRAIRAGITQGSLLVVSSAIVLLIFTSLSLAAHYGNQLGQRLTRISSTMEKVAAQTTPDGVVPVSGNDEITIVSRSFNQMVQKIGALVRMEKRQRTTLEIIQATMDTGLIVLDEENIVRDCNPAATDMLRGQQAAAEFTATLTANPAFNQLAKRQPPTTALVNWLATTELPATGKIHVGEHNLYVRAATFKVSEHEQPRTLLLLTDISEPLAEGESRVREDSFSFTLHGINNPLQTALLQSELLEMRLENLNNDSLREKLGNDISKILYQLRRIHEQAKAWGRLSGLEEAIFHPIDLNVAVHTLVEHANLDNIAIEVNLAPILPHIVFENNMLQDTLENLLANAHEQFVAVSTSQPRIKILTMQMDDAVCLEFIDNAGGIDTEILPHIFKPHKSFKPDGHGIGLARMHDWLAQADATINATNTDALGSVGAHFTINFKTSKNS